MKLNLDLSGKYSTIILVSVGGVIAALLIGLFLIRPAWNSLKQLGEEIPQAQQARNLKKQDYQNLQKADKYFKDNSQTVEQVNAAVPISPQIPSILVTLEALAKQNGVFLTSFSPQQLGVQATGTSGTGAAAAGGTAQGANPAGVESVEVTANFNGPYPSLLNFLYNLERSLRIVDVKTITVTSTKGNLEGNISFKAYYVQADGGPKAAGTDVQPAGGAAQPQGQASQPQAQGGAK